MSDRVILHSDCNAFFASVEATVDPSLNDVPMAVCGDAEKRHGIILAKNEKAKKFGIQTAETIYAAKRKCPSLVLVHPHFELYEQFFKRANEIYLQYTDLVEPFSIDESWLDVTASQRLFGDGKTIADTIRERFKRELGISCSIGVSFNKTTAKLASDLKKPDGTTVILREDYKRIVYPMKVGVLLFAGKQTVDELARYNIFTVGELAETDDAFLKRHLGIGGIRLKECALGNDSDPVLPADSEHTAKSVGSGRTFRRDLVSKEDIESGIAITADSLASRLRAAHVKCTVIHVRIKYSDFKCVSKQKKIPRPTNLMQEICRYTSELLYSCYNGFPIRSITITGTELVDEADDTHQLSLFETDDRHERITRVEDAIFKIRKKYGRDAVETGSQVNTDLK